MSNPSFSNIDLWLFELAEGNLSPKQIEQLEMFLLQHPELDVDRDVWEMAKLKKEEFHYPNQEKLERRRPVGMYVSAASIFLFMVVSTSIWFSLSNNSINQLAKEVGVDAARVFVKTVYVDKSEISNATFNSSNETYLASYSVPRSSQQANSNHYASTSNAGVDFAELTNALDAGANAFGVSAQENYTYEVNDLQIHSIQPISNSILNYQQWMFVENSSNYDLLAEKLIAFNNNETAALDVNVVEDAFAEEKGDLTDFEKKESEVPNDGTGFNSRGVSNNHTVYSSDYKNSLKSRMQTLGRKIQRMMDNPVALRNFKDPHYHVPGLSPTDVSFSSAGTMLATRVQTTSRIQWLGQENQLMTNQLSVDGYAYGLRGGLGIQLNHAYYGDGSINDASAALTYSPKFSISRKVSLEPSLRFKMGTKALTASKVSETEMVEMERGNAYDFYPEQTPIGKTLWYKDLGLGVMVNTEWFFAGVQLDNLLRHDDNIYQVDIENPQRANYHFVGTIGTDWVSKKENLGLSPYIVYQNYGRLNEAWAGMNFRWNWLTVGAAFSTGLEPAGSLGIKFEQFAMTYNVDYTNSSMTGTKNLSHQLTLRFLTKPSRMGKRLLNL